jgi:hypothetical protein
MWDGAPSREPSKSCRTSGLALNEPFKLAALELFGFGFELFLDTPEKKLFVVHSASYKPSGLNPNVFSDSPK